MRNRKESNKTQEILMLMRAEDQTPRKIMSRDSVAFACSCGAVGTKQWSEADKSFKRKGFAFQCGNCLKKKLANRGEGWLASIRAAAQTNEHKARAAANSKARIKYRADAIEAVIFAAGATYEGDISSPSNTITVKWPDGVSRSIRIRKFMIDGKIERPRDNGLSASHLQEVADLGLSVVLVGKKRARITYKGTTWDQYWANHVNDTCLRMIKNIDTGIKLQSLLDSGMSLNKACKEVGVNPLRYYRNRALGIGVAETATSTKQFERLIEIPGAVYGRKLAGCQYMPDILVESRKLIIETDGMRWHSEEHKPRDYHSKRWKKLDSLGYAVLGFSEYEVREKRPIVDSMIGHKLGKSKRFFARKTKMVELSTEAADLFFEKNHLRGRGSGAAIGLFADGALVCAMRYRKEGSEIHISRFCCDLGLAVIGGYSKLLAALPVGFDIVNFVDCRHGNGRHLLKEGFELVGEHIGFEWTDGYNHFNRRTFLGNSGYDAGLVKFFDYGQLKYVKRLRPDHDSES